MTENTAPAEVMVEDPTVAVIDTPPTETPEQIAARRDGLADFFRQLGAAILPDYPLPEGMTNEQFAAAVESTPSVVALAALAMSTSIGDVIVTMRDENNQPTIGTIKSEDFYEAFPTPRHQAIATANELVLAEMEMPDLGPSGLFVCRRGTLNALAESNLLLVAGLGTEDEKVVGALSKDTLRLVTDDEDEVVETASVFACDLLIYDIPEIGSSEEGPTFAILSGASPADFAVRASDDASSDTIAPGGLSAG